MNRRVVGTIAAIVLAVGGLAACGSSDKLTRDEFIAQMTSGDSPIPQDQAGCIYDGLESAGIKVDSDGNPSKDDEEAATQIAVKCFTDATGVDPSLIPDDATSSSDGS